jgi:hypothetical protein
MMGLTASDSMDWTYLLVPSDKAIVRSGSACLAGGRHGAPSGGRNQKPAVVGSTKHPASSGTRLVGLTPGSTKTCFGDDGDGPLDRRDPAEGRKGRKERKTAQSHYSDLCLRST